jgi:hypothetical protein
MGLRVPDSGNNSTLTRSISAIERMLKSEWEQTREIRRAGRRHRPSAVVADRSPCNHKTSRVSHLFYYVFPATAFSMYISDHSRARILELLFFLPTPGPSIHSARAGLGGGGSGGAGGAAGAAEQMAYTTLSPARAHKIFTSFASCLSPVQRLAQLSHSVGNVTRQFLVRKMIDY